MNNYSNEQVKELVAETRLILDQFVKDNCLFWSDNKMDRKLKEVTGIMNNLCLMVNNIPQHERSGFYNDLEFLEEYLTKILTFKETSVFPA